MPSKPSYLTQQQANQLINHTQNLKHKTCFLFMLDCGFRVSETVALRHSNFDFKKRTVTIQSLKKRGEAYRTLPLSDRLYDTLARYIQDHPPINSQDFLFPGKQPNTHLTRKALNRVCDTIKTKYPELDTLHPHTLRHTFATLHLANGLQLPHLKEMLGHEQLNTTAIYTHTPLELIKRSIDQVTQHKPTLLQTVNNWLYPKRKTNINLHTNSIDFTIGRNETIAKITDLVNKACNTILIGPIGVGKSHLIKQIKPEDKKILFIDDCYDIKKTLIQCLVYLYKNDKEHLFNLLYGDYDLAKLHQHLQRDSITSLTKEIIKLTQKHEYLLVIDNVDRITPRGVKALENLKDHYTILTSAREVPLNKTSFLWNFEILPIKPLPRPHSLTLIQRLSHGLEIEDFTLYRNHIYEQTEGNPRAIVELVDRYKKEVIITTDIIREIKHTGSRKEYDMSPLVIFILGGLSILRYVAYEIGNSSLKIVGGAALILLVISRYFFHFSTRKHL